MPDFSLPEEMNDIYGKKMHVGTKDRGFAVYCQVPSGNSTTSFCTYILINCYVTASSQLSIQ
jgi:hypothetical protein